MIGDIMLKILIYDDDPLFTARFKNIVDKYFMQNDFDYTVDCVTRSGELEGIDFKNYNIFFLDVELDRKNGIDLGKEIKEQNPEATIVYVSAYITYSPAGYRVKAFDYILKSDPNFERTVCECIDNIMSEVFEADKTITFRIDREPTPFLLKHILYFESDRRKVIIHTSDNFVYDTYSKLRDVEKQLSDEGFIRTRKSYIVNLRHVRRISRYIVYLDNGQTLKASNDPIVYNNVLKTFVKYRGKI